MCQVLALCPNLSKRSREACQISWQDILIPGRISVGEVVQLSKVAPKPASRHFLADFVWPLRRCSAIETAAQLTRVFCWCSMNKLKF